MDKNVCDDHNLMSRMAKLFYSRLAQTRYYCYHRIGLNSPQCVLMSADIGTNDYSHQQLRNLYSHLRRILDLKLLFHLSRPIFS